MAGIPSLRTLARELSTFRRSRRVPIATSLGAAIVAILLVALIQSGKPPATVLLYHAVPDDATGAEPSIGLTLFRRQMEFLVTRGYETVFVKDIVTRYLYGAFSERAKRLLRETGYRGAVGTVYRWGEFEDHDVFNLRRVYVSRSSRLPLMFRFMLSGYYVPTRSLALRVLNIETPRDIGCPRTTRR